MQNVFVVEIIQKANKNVKEFEFKSLIVVKFFRVAK